MQACILLSLLSLIFVCGVTGFVPKFVVTTITGTELELPATNATALTASQSRSEQQSASYHECDRAGLASAKVISSASATMMHQPSGSFRISWRNSHEKPRAKGLLPRYCEQAHTLELP